MFFFFFNDTATTEIYTLSLHDALPISDHDAGVTPRRAQVRLAPEDLAEPRIEPGQLSRTERAVYHHQRALRPGDRKSTRLNSSHANISYAVFCLKNKNKNT